MNFILFNSILTWSGLENRWEDELYESGSSSDDS